MPQTGGPGSSLTSIRELFAHAGLLRVRREPPGGERQVMLGHSVFVSRMQAN